MKKIYKLTEHIKPGELTKLLSSIIYYISILIFIIGFGFNDTPTPFGWYQQFMPNLNGQNIQDITFIDSLNGYAITGLHYILKTTTGGDNWSIIYNDTSNDIFKRIIFLNQNTGFVGGSIVINSQYYILKTTNSGTNWFYINAPFQSTYQDDMSILSEDTIWTAMSESLTGGVFRTTNGGANWVQQYYQYNNNPSHIYMYNARIGFMDGGGLNKTTDGGQTWTQIPGAGNFLDMYFIDSLTGWKCNQDMKKTTDGGLTWISQTLPYGGNIALNYMLKFSNVNRDTLWGVGGNVSYNSGYRAIIFRTTNGGNSWGFQVPDTTISIYQYFHNKFVNNLNGWAYAPLKGVHTVTGGNDTTFTGLKKINSQIVKKYLLKQNMPNPFNPVTVIKYDLTEIRGSKLEVRLVIYNILGKEIKTLVNKMQSSGEYEVTFDGSNFSSGVYFYSLIVDGNLIDTKKMVLLK